jgi:hypothetical protein
MKTVQYPPLCPYGDSSEDAVILCRPSSSWVCWPVSDTHYLRVNIHNDGDVTYLLGDRTRIQEDFLDSVEDLDLEPVSDEVKATLKKFKLRRILHRLNKLP